MEQERLEKTRDPLPYSRVGVALCLMLLVSIGAQLLIGLILRKAGVAIDAIGSDGDSTIAWLASMLPQYALGLPIAVLALKGLPQDHPDRLKPDGLSALKVCFIAAGIMFIGSIVGSLISGLLSMGRATNALDTLAMDDNPIRILFMVVIAPLAEEFLFRRVLISRTLRYGEVSAIVFSAACFGIFHMNLYQLFYAFGLGLLFGYVYVRTGRLWYTIALHMLINLFGGVIAPWLLTGVDLDAMTDITRIMNMDAATLTANLKALLPAAFYSVGYMSCAVIGIILLIVNRRSAVFYPTSHELEARGTGKRLFVNPGMLVFMIISALLTIWTLFT